MQLKAFGAELYKKPTQSTHEGLRCQKCNKQFSTKGNLKIHVKLHTGQFKFYCDTCRKGFNNLSHYKQHMRGHEGVRYHCQYCYKLFVNKVNLQYHLSSHTGQYRFKCEICGQGINAKPEFLKHLESHN